MNTSGPHGGVAIGAPGLNLLRDTSPAGLSMSLSRLFTLASNGVARGAGSPMSFAACCVIVVIWAATGPIFGYSDTWQLVINSGTSVVTFLMVFLIQSTQNRDGYSGKA
jgi:hypothetical protein